MEPTNSMMQNPQHYPQNTSSAQATTSVRSGGGSLGGLSSSVMSKVGRVLQTLAQLGD